MISLDTNVLVRILVADDPAQTKKARALVDRLDRSGQTAYVVDVVVCEVVWVLDACYGFSRQEIIDAIEKLSATKQLTFAHPDQNLRALRSYATGQGDFANYLIRENAKAAGCDAVATFDQALLKEEMFSSP